MINEIISFTVGFLVGVFRKQIVAYIKKQQELKKARMKANQNEALSKKED